MKDPELIVLLEALRRDEKGQTLFYRSLAGAAEETGHPDLERLEDLHADEQHHLSRITARLLELGGSPRDLRSLDEPTVDLSEWERVARRREAGEVERYREILRGEVEPGTREVLEEILECELHHAKELRGKWMMA